MSIIAVYPGTFDPLTNGHIDIIKRASKMVDVLIVAPAKDSGKKTLFSQAERIEMVEEEIKNLDLKNIKILPSTGSLVGFFVENNVNFIIKGLRNTIDFEKEMAMANINKKVNNVETIFLPSLDSTQFISSTIVKQVARLGGDVKDFVSNNVREKLLKKLAE